MVWLAAYRCPLRAWNGRTRKGSGPHVCRRVSNYTTVTSQANRLVRQRTYLTFFRAHIRDPCLVVKRIASSNGDLLRSARPVAENESPQAPITYFLRDSHSEHNLRRESQVAVIKVSISPRLTPAAACTTALARIQRLRTPLQVYWAGFQTL